MPKKYVSTATPEGRERRLRVFKHNALLGHTAMMHQQLRSIISSPTTTAESKALADQLIPKIAELARTLRTRNDQEETE
jgi:hypothetical protein